MTTVSLKEAAGKLAELIARLQAGEEIVIVDDNRPVARLVSTKGSSTEPRKPGTLAGTVKYMAPDFDAPLEDMKEYMP
jgi:prevent-host-death family protein